MKNFLIDIGEGLVFGVAFAVLIRILGIEVTPAQMGILAGFAIIAISLLNAIGMRLKGGPDSQIPEKQLRYHYGDNVILLQYRGLKIELLVNDQIQDTIVIKLMSLKQVTLTGKLPTGEEVKAVTGKGINKWSVFVGQEELQAV